MSGDWPAAAKRRRLSVLLRDSIVYKYLDYEYEYEYWSHEYEYEYFKFVLDYEYQVLHLCYDHRFENCMCPDSID